MERYSVRKGCPKIYHLFFADDSLIFLKASLTVAELIRQVLQLFEELSSQQVNLQKSFIFFPPEISNGQQSFLLSILGIPHIAPVLVPILDSHTLLVRERILSLLI